MLLIPIAVGAAVAGVAAAVAALKAKHPRHDDYVVRHAKVTLHAAPAIGGGGYYELKFDDGGQMFVPANRYLPTGDVTLAMGQPTHKPMHIPDRDAWLEQWGSDLTQMMPPVEMPWTGAQASPVGVVSSDLNIENCDVVPCPPDECCGRCCGRADKACGCQDTPEPEVCDDLDCNGDCGKAGPQIGPATWEEHPDEARAWGTPPPSNNPSWRVLSPVSPERAAEIAPWIGAVDLTTTPLPPPTRPWAPTERCQQGDVRSYEGVDYVCIVPTKAGGRAPNVSVCWMRIRKG